MILSKTNKEFRKKFLNKFTEELIKNYSGKEIIEIKIKLKERKYNEIEKTKKIIEENIEKEIVSNKRDLINELKKPLIIGNTQQFYKKNPIIKQPQKSGEKLQILDLGKINNLIRDPTVKTIECNGEYQNIIIIDISGEKETNITLSKEEIEDIIKKFSINTKNPIQIGVFRAVYNNLEITAITSEFTSPRFIINKKSLI